MRRGTHQSAFRRLAIALGAMLAVAALAASPAWAEKRVALVIGNSAYRNVPPAATIPTNDARLMAETLRESRLHPGRRRRAGRPRQGAIRKRRCRISAPGAGRGRQPCSIMPAMAFRCAARISSRRSKPA